MEALARDVKCFEAFEMLVGGEMMSNDEGEFQPANGCRCRYRLTTWRRAEWDFIQGLPFHAQTEDDAEFVRMMYTVRLKKVMFAPLLIHRAPTHRATSSGRSPTRPTRRSRGSVSRPSTGSGTTRTSSLAARTNFIRPCALRNVTRLHLSAFPVIACA